MLVIVVLGAQNDAAGCLSPMARSRADGALRLLRRHPHARLLLTGGHGHFNQAPHPHAYYLAQYLLSQGVEEALLLPYIESANTVEDAWLSQQALRAYTITGLVVVTSHLHMPRARLIFTHFFAPSLLTFMPTLNCVDAKTLAALRTHEEKAIHQIRQQGGVLIGNRLIRA
jgi:uncharacterized SAM-binding protein YcdF (DUF218 family)